MSEGKLKRKRVWKQEMKGKDREKNWEIKY